MAKKSMRMLFGLTCLVCKSQNYTTEKNKTNTKEKLALQKHCHSCRKTTEHKESKRLK